MSEFTCYVGEQIRRYRKAGNMTLQDLADAIHKSRATICKYENGEISVDVETLYEISQVLQVSISQLTTYLPESENEPVSIPGRGQKSPFFQAQRLYFYFYDGRSQRTKDGIIDIYEKRGETGKYEATLTICTVSANGRSSEIFYTGRVVYSDMGLLCGISSADLMPCAYKCMVTLTPQEHSESFRSQLLFTKKDLKRLEQLNMLLVDNIEQ